jgi:hypothetical protein
MRNNYFGRDVSVHADSSAGGYYADNVLLYNNGAFAASDMGLNDVIQSPFVPTMMRNEAVTKALLQIADQKVGLGEDLGTFAQTLKMLCNPVKSLAVGLKTVWNDKTLRPYLFRSIRSILNDGVYNTAAQRYLEYVYGWKPLVQDIYGLVELAKKHGSKPLLLHGRGKSQRQQQLPVVESYDISHNNKTLIGPCDIESRVQCNVWARLDPNHSGLRSLNQLGLANPLALAWELTSWSFVVDWVLPIGPVLNALTARAGLLYVDGSISNKVKVTGTYKHWYTGIDAYASSSAEASGNVGYEGYTRSPLGNWPMPGLWVDIDPLRGDRTLKATALLVLALSKLR